MRAAGVIVFHTGIRIAANRGHDIAFCNDLDLVAQVRTTQRIAQDFFGHIAAINVGLVHGGDTLVQTGRYFVAHVVWGGVCVIAQAPQPINDARKIQ